MSASEGIFSGSVRSASMACLCLVVNKVYRINETNAIAETNKTGINTKNSDYLLIIDDLESKTQIYCRLPRLAVPGTIGLLSTTHRNLPTKISPYLPLLCAYPLPIHHAILVPRGRRAIITTWNTQQQTDQPRSVASERTAESVLSDQCRSCAWLEHTPSLHVWLANHRSRFRAKMR